MINFYLFLRSVFFYNIRLLTRSQFVLLLLNVNATIICNLTLNWLCGVSYTIFYFFYCHNDFFCYKQIDFSFLHGG